MHRHTHDMIMIRRKTKNATCCRKVMQSINFPFFLYGPRVHLWTLFASIDAKKGCSWWGLRHANRTSHPIPISLAVRATSAKATKTICIFAFKRIARKLIYKIFTSNLTRWTYPVRKMCTTFYEYQVVISMMCVCLCVYFSLSFFLRVHVCLYVVCARTHWTSRGFFLHHFSKNLLLEPPCIKNHEPPFWRWKNRQSTTNNEWRKSKIVSRTNNCLANGGIIRKITTHGSRDSSSSCKSNKIAFFGLNSLLSNMCVGFGAIENVRFRLLFGLWRRELHFSSIIFTLAHFHSCFHFSFQYPKIRCFSVDHVENKSRKQRLCHNRSSCEIWMPPYH